MSDSRTTIVTERGQTSIPAALRKALHLEKGRRLLWERVSSHELRVTIVDDAAPVGAEGMRGFAKTFRDPRPTDEWMDDLREGEG